MVFQAHPGKAWTLNESCHNCPNFTERGWQSTQAHSRYSMQRNNLYQTAVIWYHMSHYLKSYKQEDVGEMNAENKTVGSWTLCAQKPRLWVGSMASISLSFSPVTEAAPEWCPLYSSLASSRVKPTLQQSCQLMLHVASPEPSQPFPAPVLTESYCNSFSPESGGAPDVDLNQGNCPLRNPHPHLGMSYFHRLFFEKPTPMLLSTPRFLFICFPEHFSVT